MDTWKIYLSTQMEYLYFITSHLNIIHSYTHSFGSYCTFKNVF